ncbi:MAG: hypothetical protein QM756_11180 [Polyangiaceae bacterium]
MNFASSYTITSPQAYTHEECFKGFVIGYSATEGSPLPSGNVGGAPGAPTTQSLEVSWADAVPSNATECNATWVGGYRFDYDFVAQTYVPVDMGSAHGLWLGARCYPAHFTFAGMPLQGLFKFAISARTSQATSAATRVVKATLKTP